MSNSGSISVQGSSISGENPATNVDSNASQYPAAFQLPKFQTPEFHGTFDTWLQFHDTFKSMCHDNSSIPNVQKFLFLKTCVKVEAAQVISSLEISSENYVVAWNLLKSRFDNRKHIVESHIKELLDIPSISKEYTNRSLLDNV
ncbi:uncharacterized protein LOC127285379 [Leptopilina boulardi]|uniref:uncharacterized protein LOC127285379 n=1 Tax=Leptopilina boulardi TaxID=63433 RepID=UPI0021F69809|nr:uncharacterized protein LOC127285379 [Leptopilina boulardi]